MADLKSAVTRVQAAVERADALRPGLTAEQVEGLDTISGNAALLRAEMDDLLSDLPSFMAVDDARGPAEQEKLDDSVAMLNRLSDILETWLEEWDA